jgi:hypothetical protein
MEAQMKASLCGLLLAGLLLVPLTAEARGGGGGGGGQGGGGHSMMGTQSVATFPFRSTVGVARQAALISRLRAQQSTSNLITASGGLLGFGGFGGGFDGFGGFGGGFSDGGGAIATGAGLETRAPTVAHPRIITMTPSTPPPGQIQIIRGTTIENVTIPSSN